MIQMIYVSAATVPFSRDDLTELLRRARLNNDSYNVSGMLLHDAGTFLQILEGPEEQVRALYNKIKLDKRHDSHTLLWDRPIEERAFGEWQMGFVDAKRAEMEHMSGYCDFFHPRFYLEGEDPDGSKALSVLTRFRGGKYRK